jgi:thiosulfate dehydrogenase [quinone] large subunit
MNANYLPAGTVSTNPPLLAVATLLVLAWKTAGWWGLDHWLLPLVGTPWRPGTIFLTATNRVTLCRPIPVCPHRNG